MSIKNYVIAFNPGNCMWQFSEALAIIYIGKSSQISLNFEG